MESPDIAPSTSPSSMARAVPVPWLDVPMARPFAIGFVILKKFSTADAVIFPSNTITVSGVSALNELGYKVPEDLAVVGFDQNDRAGIFHHDISFVNQPTNLVAEYSFDMLIGVINEEKGLSSIVVDPLLYVRA